MAWSRRALLAAILLTCACSTTGGTVRGVVIEVDGDLTSVVSFTIRTDEGDVLELTPAAGGAFEFALVHLRDHLRSSEPVLVTYEPADGRLVATAISDG